MKTEFDYTLQTEHMKVTNNLKTTQLSETHGLEAGWRLTLENSTDEDNRRCAALEVINYWNSVNSKFKYTLLQKSC